jgi:hypothetical protein
VRLTFVSVVLALYAASAFAETPFDGSYSGVSRVSGARGRDLAGKAGTHVGAGWLPMDQQCPGAAFDPKRNSAFQSMERFRRPEWGNLDSESLR